MLREFGAAAVLDDLALDVALRVNQRRRLLLAIMGSSERSGRSSSSEEEEQDDDDDDEHERETSLSVEAALARDTSAETTEEEKPATFAKVAWKIQGVRKIVESAERTRKPRRKGIRHIGGEENHIFLASWW